ncbi:MAG: glycoside hydrolase family 88 protein [Acholeplasmataceae bacterium]|nr:glycoside hydrolase family 88 protein [Acholeplasmataceae bacterium]
MYKLIDRFIDKLIKESTPDRPLWNIESINQGKKPHWNYIDGCMMTSLLSLYDETKDPTYLSFVKSFIDYYVNDQGDLLGYHKENFSTDDICESRVLFDLYHIFKEEKYLLAIEKTYEQIKEHPRTYEGNFWHKKIYPHQVWLDGLFMAQPFYTKYETFLNNKKNYHDIKHQFEVVRARMFNEDKKLYYHGYDASRSIFWADKTTGLSQNFWLRAMGWYVVAIVDVYQDFHDEEIRQNFFKPLLKEIVDGLLSYQDQKTKLFYQVVDKAYELKNYLEASGSALISYAILKGVRLGALDQDYQQKGLAIFDGITQTYLTDKDGDLNLGGICLVAGLGPENNLRRDGSFAYYMSEPVVENDAKGVGPLIMAYTEVIKILKK